MSLSTALDGIESILTIIKKGDAPPEQKLKAILHLSEVLRNDIQDLADEAYAEYVPDLPPPTFDMKEAIESLLVAFRLQEYNNLYSFYNLQPFADEPDPHVRNAMAQALVKLAVEQKREPNPTWASIIQTEGVISEDDA
jgi:hypothetical protein